MDDDRRLACRLNEMQATLDIILGWVCIPHRKAVHLRLVLCGIHPKRRIPMAGVPITLRNTEVAVMHIEYDYTNAAGAETPIAEAGVVPILSVTSAGAPTVIATLRPDNLTADIVSIDGAVGNSVVTVSATLPDGVALSQTQQFNVVNPEADAITLTVDAPTPKVPAAPPAPPAP